MRVLRLRLLLLVIAVATSLIAAVQLAQLFGFRQCGAFGEVVCSVEEAEPQTPCGGQTSEPCHVVVDQNTP